MYDDKTQKTKPIDDIDRQMRDIGMVRPAPHSDIASQKSAIERGASALGVDPTDYATAMSYESARTFDPWVKGPVTKWGQHRGTIQYGEPQQKQYGVTPDQTFEDQVTRSNVKYLKDHGVKPGMKFAQLYAAINGGNVNKDLNTPDANTGRTIADNIRIADQTHRPEVIKRFGFGKPSNFDFDSFARGLVGTPTSTTFHTPQPSNLAPDAQEAPITLEAQRTAAHDPQSSRIGVLYTQGVQPPPPSDNEYDIPITGEQTLRVDKDKFGVWNQQTGVTVNDLAQGADFTPLIGGKAENTGEPTRATGTTAVVSKHKDGHELVSSIVTDPASVPVEAALQKKQFPNEDIQTSVTPAADVTAMREQDQPQMPQGAPGDADFQAANDYLTSQGQPEITREAFDAAQQAPGSVDVSTPDVNDPGVQGAMQEQAAQEQEIGTPTPDGGRVRFPRQVGKSTDGLNGTAGIYTSAKGMSEEDAFRNGALAIGSKYGLDPQQVTDYISKIKASGKPLFADGYHPGNELAVTFGDLQAMGVDARQAQAMEQAQNQLRPEVGTATEAPAGSFLQQLRGLSSADVQKENLGADPLYQKAQANIADYGGTDDDVMAEYQRLQSNQNINQAISMDYGEQQGSQYGPVRSALVGQAGRGVSAIAGALQIVRTLAPLWDLAGGDQLAEMATNTGLAMQKAEATESKRHDDAWSSIIRTAVAAPGDVSRLIVMSRIPGGASKLGAMVTFGADAGLQSIGRGSATGEVFKDTAKGAAMGLVLDGATKWLAPAVKTAIASRLGLSPEIMQAIEGGALDTAYTGTDAAKRGAANVARRALVATLGGEAARVGAIGGGTYALAKIEGSDHPGRDTAMMLLTDLAMNAKGFGDIKRLSKQVWRVPGETPDDLPRDYMLLSEGGDKLAVYDVTGKMPDEAIQGTIGPDPDRTAFNAKHQLTGFNSINLPSEMPTPKTKLGAELTLEEKAQYANPKLDFNFDQFAKDLNIQTNYTRKDAVEPGTKVEIDGNDAVVVEDRGNSLVVDTNPTQKGGETVYQSREQVKKTNVTPSYEVVNKLEFTPREKGGIVPTESESATLTAHDAATSPENNLPEPTQAQKEAGNFQHGHINVNGLDISIENPVGSQRTGTNREGKTWSRTMQHHYGYLKGSIGADKEHIDVFVKDHTPTDFTGDVYVVDQIRPDSGTFDEHKIMLGFDNEQEARDAYAANYAKDWKGLQSITAMPFEKFKDWATAAERRTPVAKHPETTLSDVNSIAQVETLPQSVHGQAAAPNDMANSGDAAAQSLADFAQQKAFREHGLGSFDVPTQRVVFSSVLSAIKNLQVRKHIVKFIPVDVVDNLVSIKDASQVSLHDKAVFRNLLAIDPNHAVSVRVDAVDAIIRSIAESGAESSAMPGVSDISLERDAAPQTDKGMPISSPNLGANRTAKGSVRVTLSESPQSATELNPADKTDTINVGHDTNLQKNSIMSGGSESESGSPSILSPDEPLAKVRTAEAYKYLSETLPAMTGDQLMDVPADELDVGKFNPDKTELELSERAAEVLRKIQATVSGKDVKAWDGSLWRPASFSVMVPEVHNAYDAAIEAGYTDEKAGWLKGLADNLETLRKESEQHGIVYVYQDSLKEERTHRDDILAGSTDPQARTSLKESPFITDPGEVFTSEYPNVSQNDKMAEIFAKLATGQESHYGWDKMPDFEQAKEHFLDTYADGILRNNGVETQEQFEAFADKYKRLRYGTIAKTITETSESNIAPTEPDSGGVENTAETRGPPAEVPTIPAQEGERAEIPESGAIKTRKTILSAENHGVVGVDEITGHARLYPQKSSDERTARAQAKIERLGLQAATDEAMQPITNLQTADEQNTFRWQTVHLLNREANAAMTRGDNAQAEGYLAARKAIVEAIAADQTAGGRYVQSGSEVGSKDDADTVVEYVNARRRRQGYGEPTTAGENKALVSSADDLAAAQAKIGSLEAKLAELESQMKGPKNRPLNRAQKALLTTLRENSENALKRIQGMPLQMVAWHGSPHTFDKFDSSKIGTGEGAQAYGHGLYFTDKESVAQHYKDALSVKNGSMEVHFPDTGVQMVMHKIGDMNAFSDRVDRLAMATLFNHRTMDKALAFAEEQIKSHRIARELYQEITSRLNEWKDRGASVLANEGAKYKVDLKPHADDYLLWDKPLSEQSEKVKKALENASRVGEKEKSARYERLQKTLNEGGKLPYVESSPSDRLSAYLSSVKHGIYGANDKGSQFYKTVADAAGSDIAASDYLLSLGIRGIKYLDGSSRGKGEGSHNYVIFSHDDVTITDILKSVARPPDQSLQGQVLNDLSDVGAAILFNGFNDEDIITPAQFETEFNKQTDNKYADNWRQVHAESMAKLKGLRDEMRKRNAIDRIKGENLLMTDDEALAKFNEERAKDKERAAVRGEHTRLANEIIFAASREAAQREVEVNNAWKERERQLQKEASQKEREIEQTYKDKANEENADKKALEIERKERLKELEKSDRETRIQLERQFKAKERLRAKLAGPIKAAQQAELEQRLAHEENVYTYLETAAKLNPQASDDVLALSALLHNTPGITVEEAGKFLKRISDEYTVPENASATETKAVYNKVANTIADAKRLRDKVNKDNKEQADIARGKTDEVKQQLADAKRERLDARKNFDSLVARTEKPPMSAVQKATQLQRMMMVSAINTATNNLWSGMATRGMVRVVDGVDLAIQRFGRYMGKELKDEGITADTQWADIFGYPRGNDGFKEYFRDTAFAHNAILAALDEHPELFNEIYGDYSSDIQSVDDIDKKHGVVHKILDAGVYAYDKANFANRWQEYFVRDLEALSALQVRLGQRGLDFNTLRTEGRLNEINLEDWRYAIDRARKVTYAMRPERGSSAESILRTLNNHPVPAVIVAPFAKFSWNVWNLTRDWLPVAAQIRAGRRVMSEEDARVRDLFTPTKYTSRELANNLTGFIFFAAALGLTRALGDRDDWYYLKIPFSDGMGRPSATVEKVLGVTQKNSALYIDMRQHPEFAPFLYLANKFNRLIEGKDVFNYDDPKAIASELGEVFLSLSYRQAIDQNSLIQGSGYLAQSPVQAGRAMLAKLGMGDGTESKDPEKAWDLLSKFAGERMGVAFSPFRPLKNVTDSLSKTGDLDMDAYNFTQGFERNLPKYIFEKTTSIPHRTNVVTGDPKSFNPYQWLKPFGLNVVDDQIAEPEMSQTLRTAKKLDIKSGYTPPVTEEEKNARDAKKDIYKAMERLRGQETPDMTDEQKKALYLPVTDALKRVVENKTLTQGQADYIGRSIGKSELQGLVKGGTVANGLTVYKTSLTDPKITDGEREALQGVIQRKLNKKDEKLSDEDVSKAKALGFNIIEVDMPDAVKKEFDKYEMDAPNFGEDIKPKGAEKVRLSNPQYDKYKRESLQRIYQALDDEIKTPDYQQSSSQEQQLIIKKIVSKLRAGSRKMELADIQ